MDDASARLDAVGVPRARVEGRHLMAWLLGTDVGGVVARWDDPLPEAAAARFRRLLSRRAKREPLQYLTGEQEFLGLEIHVDARALVPRPETEILVERLLELPLPESALVVDVGTGTGCIAVALAVARPHWNVVALDRSGAALRLARTNAQRHRVSGRVWLLRADLSQIGFLGASADAVVSNPPYVSEEEWRDLAPEVRDHEPKDALVPGPTGLEAYRELAPAARRALRPGGLLALELGWRSESAVRKIVSSAGFVDLQARPDLQDIPRVLTARNPEWR